MFNSSKLEIQKNRADHIRNELLAIAKDKKVMVELYEYAQPEIDALSIKFKSFIDPTTSGALRSPDRDERSPLEEETTSNKADRKPALTP